MWLRPVLRSLVALLLVINGVLVAELGHETIRRWRERPVDFVRENFQVEPDAWQVDVLNAFADRDIQRISMQACAGPGKTAVEAWCAWNFLGCYGNVGDHPNGAAVSITQTNLRDNLWKELAKWQARSAYLSSVFTWTAERVFANAHPATWWLSARSWPKSANADEQGKTLSGLHGNFCLAIIDESGAIPTTVNRAAEQMLSTRPWFGKIMQGGNTLSLDGMLYAAATHLRELWHVIRITGDPDDPKRSPRIDIEWAREQIRLYGRDNSWVKAYILGEFPAASINALFSVEDIEAAMKRHLREDQYGWAQKRLGVDVARYGDDLTVIFPRQGLACFKPQVMRHDRGSAVSVNIASKVMDGINRWGAEVACFDATGGWAAGAVDVMRSNGHNPIDVQFHAPANNPKFYNRRAEIYFSGSEWLTAGGALPYNPTMIREMTATTYTFKDGKFLIEPKDQFKKRLGFSPDHTDAWALTFGLPDAPGKLSIAGMPMGQPAHAKTDWDPYAEGRS